MRFLTWQDKDILPILKKKGIYIPDKNLIRCKDSAYEAIIEKFNGKVPIWGFANEDLLMPDNIGLYNGLILYKATSLFGVGRKNIKDYYLYDLIIPDNKVGKINTYTSIIFNMDLNNLQAVYSVEYFSEDILDNNWYRPKVTVVGKYGINPLYNKSFSSARTMDTVQYKELLNKLSNTEKNSIEYIRLYNKIYTTCLKYGS